MRRIEVWVDCEDDESEAVRSKVEVFLRSLKLTYTFVDLCEILKSHRWSK